MHYLKKKRNNNNKLMSSLVKSTFQKYTARNFSHIEILQMVLNKLCLLLHKILLALPSIECIIYIILSREMNKILLMEESLGS